METGKDTVDTRMQWDREMRVKSKPFCSKYVQWIENASFGFAMGNVNKK